MFHRAPLAAFAAVAVAVLSAPMHASAQKKLPAKPPIDPCCAAPSATSATPGAPCCNVVSLDANKGVAVIRDERTHQLIWVQLTAPRSPAALALHQGLTIAHLNPVDSERGTTSGSAFKIGGPVAFQPVDGSRFTPVDGTRFDPVDSGRITGVVVKITGF